MLRESTSSVAQNRWMASNQPSAEAPSHQNAFRPSDILELKNETRAYIDATQVHHNHTEPALRPPPSPRKPTSKPYEQIPTNYVIPQKRVTQLQSFENAAATSAQLPPSHRDNISRPRPPKEKVIGGLSKEDQLQAIWADFDEQERRQRFKPEEQGGGKPTSGNDVLGAWEEEVALHDLDDEEGPW
jgi:hypothetical protein